MANKKCPTHLLFSSNRRLAKKLWGDEIDLRLLHSLREFTEQFSFSVARGEIQLLQGNWYVTHAGLISLAHRSRCCGLYVQPVSKLCDSTSGRWVFKAVVYKNPHSKGFAGFGDADPSNVSLRIRGAEMRMAETRAVNRALRKAYGIGLCSVEELGWSPRPSDRDLPNLIKSSSNGDNATRNGQPRLRDRLCLLIRQHQLDPNLVKAYAADYCGTATLRDASRDLVEAFINDLADRATKDREGLLCHLNSYAKPQGMNS